MIEVAQHVEEHALLSNAEADGARPGESFAGGRAATHTQEEFWAAPWVMIRVLRGCPPVSEVNLPPACSTVTWAFRRKHPKTTLPATPEGQPDPSPWLSAQQARCLVVPAHTGAPFLRVGHHISQEKPVRLPHRKHTTCRADLSRMEVFSAIAGLECSGGLWDRPVL